jgi:hypothetical protein
MRIHRQIVLGSAMVAALAVGMGCARESSAHGANGPTTYTPYSTTNAGSNAYGNAGTGYSTPSATGGGPSTPPSSGDAGLDHPTVPGTGSMDDVPSSVGGGPMDQGSPPKPTPNEQRK